MRKSIIAATVVASAGLVATANAGYWAISGANYVNGGANNVAVSQLNNQISTWVSTNFAGSSGTQTSLAASDVTNVLSNLSVSLSNNTLTYFGFEDTAQGPGYFGIAFKNTSGSSYYFSMNGGSQAAGGTEGVLTSHTGTIGGFGGSWTAAATVANNTTLLVIFGGLNTGVGFQFQTESVTSSGGTGGTSFGISYLNYSAGAYSSIANVGSATSSGLNTALYQVPVPAPALLAGVGLLGAAAARRRLRG